ncbi:MAG: SDR family oxidoreductase [Pseudomonadota bacterium]
MPTVLVTGANRGIGLEFVRQYAGDGWRVLACCRTSDAASGLKSVEGEVSIHPLDVASPTAIRAIGAEIDAPLDVVVANAGLGGKAAESFGAINYDGWDETFAVNVRGVVATAEAFAPHLKRAEGKFAAISSLMGSIEDASSGALCYRSTKAAVNMAMKIIAAEFEADGVAAAPFHPGWVKTDMGGSSAPTTVEESVDGLRRQINVLQATASPQFLDFRGEKLPW